MALLPFIRRFISPNVSSPVQGNIKLGNNVFSRQNAVVGEVTLNVSRSLELKGVWIELVSLAGSLAAGKGGQVLFRAKDLSPGNPCMALIGTSHPAESKDSSPAPDFTVEEGSNKYNFTFKLNGDYTVPATYKSNCGGVEHRLVLVAYLTNDSEVSLVDERTVIVTRGYLDLLSRPEIFTPVEVVATRTKSLFSSSVLLQATLDMPKSGYLPGESVKGTIMIANPSGEMVEEAVIECIRKVVYFAGHLYKRTTTFLAQDSLVLKSTEVLIISNFTFQLPPTLLPTWQSPNGNFKFKHIVQFTVKTAEGTSVKGKTDIVIGSHAGDLGPIMESRVSTPIREDFVFNPSGSPMRRSTESLPRSMYMMSSRRASVATLSHLPDDSAALPQKPEALHAERRTETPFQSHDELKNISN